MRIQLLALGSLLFGAACTSGAADSDSREPDSDPPVPAAEARLSESVDQALRSLAGSPHDLWGAEQQQALDTLAASEDQRVAWVLSDLLRVVDSRDEWLMVRDAANQLLGTPDSYGWLSISNHLMREDIAAPPGYLELKRAIYVRVERAWRPLFVEGAVDWRFVTWGGVRIDDRPYGETHLECNCIPAADNPGVESAADAAWLDDGDVVFGIVVGGEARAYPRRIMEVREMVNDSLGGRRLGIPYCTLCASAQAYFTDVDGPGRDPLVLRTSGLLLRSNKLMYELRSKSVLDTFRGAALTGPLKQRAVQLEQATVVTTTWGAWRRSHPETTVLVEELALGRNFDFRSGRDAEGPIFPIGRVDSRLPAQHDVFGVFGSLGRPVAFDVEAARARLVAGATVSAGGVTLALDGDGLRAVDARGAEVPGHQAFWFAWSQVYPTTELWTE